ncbi:MAG TPA: hypothetical protein VEC19_08885 [Usitatibacter sp.]|nr:hypothetical protein [Usitatibacter sp.]
MSDALDRILRRDAREAALPDDGFSARVMQSLPPRQQAARGWLTSVLVFASTAVGAALAVALSPAAGSMLQGFYDLAQSRVLTQGAIAALAISATLLVSVVILASDLE